MDVKHRNDFSSFHDFCLPKGSTPALSCTLVFEDAIAAKPFEETVTQKVGKGSNLIPYLIKKHVLCHSHQGPHSSGVVMNRVGNQRQ